MVWFRRGLSAQWDKEYIQMANETEHGAGHLEENRTVILLRSLLVGVSSALPLPGVSELITGSLKRGLLQHVAGLRRVDLTDAAVDELLSEPPKRKNLGVFAAIGGLAGVFRRRSGRGLRRLFVGLQVLQALDESLRMFQLGILLDHYCASFHVGAALDGDKARQLRLAFEDAQLQAQRGLISDSLATILTQLTQVALALPQWVWSHIQKTGTPPVLPSMAGLVAQTQALLSELGMRRYLNRLATCFDKKWSGAAVITVN
jgi:hypothetical protein